ncbi:hypothetical protein CDO51_12255 [Natranaerobius trueperi]|uniref:Uncharacterized protein n=1 Tax=Natranaerobius trueperi TaxID=759412 RepID=A0A226BVJ7_9FIRM|nr:hypothetical protein CDO51_12255 [Natranaerobius trueperi]
MISQKNNQVGINIDRACKEHDEFVDVFKSNSVEVIPAEIHQHINYQVNTRDLGVTTPKGIIMGRFFKAIRRGEHRLFEHTLSKYQIPIYHKLSH